MRGKGRKRRRCVFRSGITPAYAGKSHPATDMQKIARDHPRLCGEKMKREHKLTNVEGSPPPMRGKEQSYTPSVSGDRITPAYAGKSHKRTAWAAAERDHPRLCGEKGRVQNSTFSTDGSPPPMRGKAIHNHLNGYYTRITPAYAGKRDCRKWRAKS